MIMKMSSTMIFSDLCLLFNVVECERAIKHDVM